MPHPSGGYRDRSGNKLLGTTTVIGRWKESGGLIQWAYKQGREHGDLAARGKEAPRHLYDQVDEAANLGTQAHELVELHIKGEPYTLEDKDPRVKSAFDAYLQWERHTRVEVVMQEVMLVDEAMGYGGTPDAIGRIDGELCLLDWKTSNSVYPDHLIQLAAYKHLIEDGVKQDDFTPLDMKLTGGFHLCRFAKNYGDFAHHYYPELDIAWEQFASFIEAYKRDKVLKQRAA